MNNIPAAVVEKFLKDSKGNFFQKVSFGAPPFGVFFLLLFASFSFVPTCSKEKEELWNLITEWTEYLCLVSFPSRFFFESAGAKKKLLKRNAKRETRKRELFEKSSLLNSRKNFPATDAGMLAPGLFLPLGT